jgi:hypothetical protein
LDLQLCGSHAKAAAALAKTARDSFLLAEGINTNTIISNTTNLERIANEYTVSGDSFNHHCCGAVQYRER